jgi:Tfp pilus assembly protein PilV
MLRRHPHALLRLRDERGVTLIELLVAMVTGLIVSGAAFSILNISLAQTSRIADRVSADQRGRVALENIMLELHSSCVAPKTTPVEPGSKGTELRIVSNTGAQASFSAVTEHRLELKEEEKGIYKLVDASYLNTGAKPAPEWEFAAKPTKTVTLLTGVSESTQENEKKEKVKIPVFQYYKYEGGELSKTPLAVPLKGLEEKEAEETAAITVTLTVAPASKTKDKREGERSVNLSDTAVLRFSPASTSSANFPCT